jgi:hypothetical protein
VLSNSDDGLRTIVYSQRCPKKSSEKYTKNYVEGIKYGNLTPSPSPPLSKYVVNFAKTLPLPSDDGMNISMNLWAMSSFYLIV